MKYIYITVSPNHLTRCISCARHHFFDETESEQTILSQKCQFCGETLIANQQIMGNQLKVKALGNRSSKLTMGLLSAGLLLGGCNENQITQLEKHQIEKHQIEKHQIEPQIELQTQLNQTETHTQPHTQPHTEPHTEPQVTTSLDLGVMASLNENIELQRINKKQDSQMIIGRSRPELVGGLYGSMPSMQRKAKLKTKINLTQPKILSGSFPSTVAYRIMRSRSSAYQYCYERELKRNPNLQGKLDINVQVSVQGQVTQAQIISSTLKSPTVETCIIRHLQKLRFPHSKNGKPIKFSYSMKFMRNAN